MLFGNVDRCSARIWRGFGSLGAKRMKTFNLRSERIIRDNEYVSS